MRIDFLSFTLVSVLMYRHMQTYPLARPVPLTSRFSALMTFTQPLAKKYINCYHNRVYIDTCRAANRLGFSHTLTDP